VWWYGNNTCKFCTVISAAWKHHLEHQAALADAEEAIFLVFEWQELAQIKMTAIGNKKSDCQKARGTMHLLINLDGMGQKCSNI
jgi:hypothetical protein